MSRKLFLVADRYPELAEACNQQLIELVKQQLECAANSASENNLPDVEAEF